MCNLRHKKISCSAKSSGKVRTPNAGALKAKRETIIGSITYQEANRSYDRVNNEAKKVCVAVNAES